MGQDIFGECEVTVLARDCVGSVVNINLDHNAIGAASFWDSSLLAFPCGDAKVTQLIAIFNYTVWSLRGRYFAKLGVPMSKQKAVDTIADDTLYEWFHCCLSSKSKKGKRPSLYGSAGCRSAKQEAAACAYVDKLVNEMGSDAIIGYTDGSALGNPGPAGAGAYVIFPACEGFSRFSMEGSVGLGHGTNNTGEIWAQGMYCEIVKSANENGYPTCAKAAFLLSDSCYAIGVTARGHKAKSNRNVIDCVRKEIKKCPVLGELHLRWVPAHMGIDGNEHADILAKAGAALSKRDVYILDMAAACGQFLRERHGVG